MPESNTPTNNNPRKYSGSIEINRQTDFVIDEPLIGEVVSAILSDHGFHDGSISIAIIDDPSIHELNVRYLQHDYPTDVLSFVLESDPQRRWLEGEVIVSSDTALRESREYGWPPENELMLYIIHGTLHLAGLDDKTDELRFEMRQAETMYLKLIGRERPPESPDSSRMEAETE